jgi:GT2 family glycosyltransferase
MLLDAFRHHVLGTDRSIAPDTRVAVGLVTYDSEAFWLRRATNAALLSLKYAGLPAHRTLWVLDNGKSSESEVPQDARIVRLPSGGNVGVGAGHNQLMRAAFAEGATVYVAIDSDGILNHDAVGALVRMVQAHDGRALVEALQLPTDDPKPYDPVTLDTPWVSGVCIALSRSVFEELDGFDGGFFMFGKDMDLSRRAQAAGFALKICPTAVFLRAVTNRKISAQGLAKYDR